MSMKPGRAKDGPVILCDECNATEMIGVGPNQRVIRHRDSCTQPEICMQRTTGYYGGLCLKPKRGELKNGAPACGIHLAAERKRDEADQKLTQAISLQNYIRDETEKKAQQIRDLLGIRVELHYSFRTRGYTGKVTIDPDELLPLIDGE